LKNSALVLPSLIEIEAERCRRSLRDFIAAAWPLVEPATEFIPNWHIDVIAEHLEAATHGEIKKLVINIPPRHMKSLQVCVFWPAWVWLTHPEKRFLYASYAERLSTTHSVMTRRLISSKGARPAPGQPQDGGLLERYGYQGLLELLYAAADRWALCGDQNLKRRFENTRTGMRLATSVGGSVTGEGGDILVLDDPHKPEEAQSDVIRQGVIDWHDGTWTTRLNDAESGVQVIVMQRLHEADLTGHVLERGGYEHLCLPAEYEPSHPFAWPEDPRTQADEVLWEKWGAEWLAEKREELGSYGFAGQYQQRPSPAEGGILKRDWWRFYDELPEPKALMISWDMTYKDSDGSDYVVGQLWLRDLADLYLVAQVRARLDITETVKAVQALHDYAKGRWPDRPLSTLVEDRANGPAVISMLRSKMPGLIPIQPEGGKESRAHAVAPQIEAGNVHLPHGHIPAPGSYETTPTEAFVEECAAFPRGAHDDQVDAMSQVLPRLVKSGSSGEVRTGGYKHDVLR
jgi:predicted phage terminase large subunit-like protein